MKGAIVHTMGGLAERIPGAELSGNPDHEVRRLVHPAEVAGPEDLSLIMTLEVLSQVNGMQRCAVINRKLMEELADLEKRFDACLIVDRPRHALALLSRAFPRRRPSKPGIHLSAVIEAGAVIADDCSIGAHVWIGPGAKIGCGTEILASVSIGAEALIGENCTIYPSAYIGDRVEIGNRVIIHPNAVIGGDGFAFETPSTNNSETARRGDARTSDHREKFERIDSLGTVRIEDDVEIGACTTIDRSTLGATIVRRGTKIDNLVQIGHGNSIGSHALICSQVGLAGSCEVGDGAILAGKVGVADHRKIGENAVLMAKSGVTKDVPAGEVYYGMPAKPVKDTLRNYSLINRITEMRKQLKQLETAIGELSGKVERNGA